MNRRLSSSRFSSFDSGDDYKYPEPEPFGYFPRPRERNFLQKLYDKQNKTTFDRDCSGWFLMCTYWILFVMVLTNFTILYHALWFYVRRIDPDGEPVYRFNICPGLSLHPISPEPSPGPSVITFSLTKNNTIDHYVDSAKKFMKKYNGSVNLEDYGECNVEKNFEENYKMGKPCAFLKLNKIINWSPEVINDTINEMPSQLQSYIQSLEDKQDKIWISCTPTNGEIGNVSYYPSQYFDAKIYSFNSKDIRSKTIPPVAIHFQNLVSNIKVGINCKTWAKNIPYEDTFVDPRGSVYLFIHILP